MRPALTDEQRARIRQHALTCPHPQCVPDDDDDGQPCTGFVAGSLHCLTENCPNPRHRPHPPTDPEGVGHS
jgi:hypothetical protein